MARSGGFQPQRYGSGGTVVYRRRQITSNNSNPISCFDAVTQDTNGNLLGLGVSSTHSTAVSTVVCGVSYQDAQGNRAGYKNLPASTTYSGTGIWPTDAIFATAVDNVVGVAFYTSIDSATDRADIDANYSINLRAAVNGYSDQDLAEAGKNNTATLPFRFLDFVDKPGIDITAADVHVLALINAGTMEPALTTTGLA